MDLSKERILPFNPAADLDLPRVGKRLPRHVLTSEEAEMVLCQPDITDPIGLRDRAMLEVLYSTGIRRLEAVKLKLIDVEPPEKLRKTTPWQVAYKLGITENTLRNKHIVAECIRAARYGLTAVVLVQRKDHGKILFDLMQRCKLRAA